MTSASALRLALLHAQSRVHLNPQDAVDVHREVRAKNSIGMHWGTFTLTTEPVMEPPARLAEFAKEAGLAPDEFTVLKLGETDEFPRQR